MTSPRQSSTARERPEAVLDMIRQCMESAGTDLRGYKIVLFGSRAAGRAGPRSDFDIGVIGERPMPLDVFFQIEDKLEALPTLYSIDWVDLSRALPAFRENALKEASVIYE
jgi:predicted nucleotidyltransferase